MKSSILQKLRTVIVILILIAYMPVNTSGQTCDACSGTLISNAQFEAYKTNYKNIFIGNDQAKINKHPEWFYLPKTYIDFFSNYLKTVSKADGIWIFFVNNGFWIDKSQQKDLNQIMLNISGSEGCMPEYDKFNTCVKGSAGLKSKNKIHISTRKNDFSSSTIDYTHILGKTSEKILENSFRYAEAYGTVKYSMRMHLSRKHIDQLKSAIDNSGGNWNGIKLYFGVYNQIINCTGMQDVEQLTLIALPVKDQNNNGNIEDYNGFLKKNKLVRNDADILNHGALCPQICN